MKTEGVISSLTRWLLFLVLIVGIMIICRTFLLPLIWAIFLALLLHPVAARLESLKIPRAAATLLVVLSVAAVFVGFLVLVTIQMKGFVAELADVRTKAFAGLQSVEAYLLDHYGFDIQPMIDSKMHANEGGGGFAEKAMEELLHAGSAIAHVILVPVYLFFLLLYRRLIRQFIYARFAGPSLTKALAFLRRTRLIVKLYMVGTLAVTSFLAIAAMITLLVLGVKHALFLAFLVGVLNLIPYVGNLISFAFIFLYTWITKDSLSSAVIVIACFQVAHILQENLVRPWILGSKLEMNAFWVFVSVIIGGTIWGISGMILFVPFTAIIKALLEIGDDTKEWAILLGEDRKLEE